MVLQPENVASVGWWVKCSCLCLLHRQRSGSTTPLKSQKGHCELVRFVAGSVFDCHSFLVLVPELALHFSPYKLSSLPALYSASLFFFSEGCTSLLSARTSG